MALFPPNDDRSFRKRVVSLTFRSPTSYVVPLRSETSAVHEYASFSQKRKKKVRYACIYLFLSATDQAKAVREVTQYVSETTSEDSEQDVAETTRRRNDRKPSHRHLHHNFSHSLLAYFKVECGGDYQIIE